MGTPINPPNESSRPPSATLPEIGNWIDAAVIDEQKVPAYIFGTREQAMTQSGKPKTQDLLTVLVIRGTGLTNDPGSKDKRPVAEGDVVSIYVEGQSRWDPDRDKMIAKGEFKSWSGAKEDHGQLCRGDVLRWRYESDLQGKGAQPRKVRTFRLRSPKAEEAAQTARCEQLHRDGTAQPVGAYAGDEEPF